MRVIAVLVLLAAQICSAQTTFHGNNARTGVYESAGPTKAPSVKWTFKTGGAIVASVAIAERVVDIASTDAQLYANRSGNRREER